MIGASSPASPSPSRGPEESQARTLVASDVSVHGNEVHPHKTARGLHEELSDEHHDGSIRPYGGVEDIDGDDNDEKSSQDSRKDSLESNLNTDELPLLTTANALPIEEEERAVDPSHANQHATPPRAKSVSWMSLPRKDQLVILVLARLSEPISQQGLNSYLFYQLRSFDPSAADSTISYQAGALQAAFTGAQFCTAILWGRCADSEKSGRKQVILIGLFGTAIGALGFGFSRSFAAALFWRALGGALNGNVGVMRTMVSEIIREKKFQARAFLLLPLCFNIGVIIGPILGGWLADPAGSYPHLFGPGSPQGGANGVWWMIHWPYALPNLVSAIFIIISALAVFFGLEETLESIRAGRPDLGLRISSWIGRTVFRRGELQHYDIISNRDQGDVELNAPISPRHKSQIRKLPFRRIWTPNVLFVFLAHGLLSIHIGGFNFLINVFLSTPRYTPGGNNESLLLPADWKPHGLSFTGGLALPPQKIGNALAILGFIGITLQLLLYPRVSSWLGTVKSFRIALCLCPLAYFLMPFLAIVHSANPPPLPASGVVVWVAIILVLLVQVSARTFVLPATVILVNNASPHPSVLSTIHGIAQSVSSAMRTFGPILISYLYGLGLSSGYVILAWFVMAGMGVLGAFAGLFVREGDGHEIWLEGEKEEEETKS